MSKSERTVSETTNNSDGVTNQPVSGETPKTSETKTVSWEDHQRALKDMHKFKEELRDLKEEKESAEKKRLADNEQWKQLADVNEKKYIEEADKRKQQNEIYLNTVKTENVKRVAVSNGIKQEAIDDLELLEFAGVEVEVTSRGRFNTVGAESFVTNLKNSNLIGSMTRRLRRLTAVVAVPLRSQKNTLRNRFCSLNGSTVTVARNTRKRLKSTLNNKRGKKWQTR